MFNKNNDLQKEIDEIKRRKNSYDYNSNYNQDMRNDYNSNYNQDMRNDYNSNYNQDMRNNYNHFGREYNQVDDFSTGNYDSAILLKNKSSYSASDSKIFIAIITSIIVIFTIIVSILEPDNIQVYVFLTPFEAVGLYGTICKLIKIKRQKVRCTQLVQATVVQVRESRGSKGSRTYCPVFEFEYGGQKYIIDKNIYGSHKSYRLEIGSSHNFYVNPNDLSDNYRENLDFGEMFFFAIFGLVGFGMAILSIFSN